MYTSIRTLLLALGLALPVVSTAQVYTGTMNRASFVQTLMSTKGIPSGGSNCFTDVRTESFAAAVCGARNNGIVSGNPNGQFRPYDGVTFIEAAAMVVRAERVSVASDSIWYRPYIEKLNEWNAIPASINNILSPLSSAQATELISKVAFRNNGSNSSSWSSSSSAGSQTDGDLTVSTNRTTVEPGDRVTFTIRIRNDRSRDIETDLNAFLDDDMEFDDASDDGEEIEEDEEVEWQDIEIDEDDSETVTLEVRIDDSADDGDTLRVRFETDDDEVTVRLNVDDNDDCACNDDDDDNDADIEVSISESDDPVEQGDTITYRIRLTNNSNDDEETDVTALLDDDTTFVSASEGGSLEGNDEVEWSDIEVREDRTITLLLTVRVDSSADDGDTLELDVETDDDEDTEETEVEDDDDDNDNDGDEDIDISINASDSSVRVGDTVTFQIRMENNDDQDIQPVIRAYLDDAMSYLTSGNGGELIGDDEIKWDDVEIEEDDDRTIQLTVRINDRVRAGDTLVLRVTAGNDERSVTIRGE